MFVTTVDQFPGPIIGVRVHSLHYTTSYKL